MSSPQSREREECGHDKPRALGHGSEAVPEIDLAGVYPGVPHSYASVYWKWCARPMPKGWNPVIPFSPKGLPPDPPPRDVRRSVRLWDANIPDANIGTSSALRAPCRITSAKEIVSRLPGTSPRRGTNRSVPGTVGRGRSTSPSIQENTVVLEPMPKARQRTTPSAKPGTRRRERSANYASRLSASIPTADGCRRSDASRRNAPNRRNNVPGNELSERDAGPGGC
jgi:hypothetical protein